MARGLYVIDQLGPIELADRPAFNTFTTFADVYGAPQKILPRSICDAGLTLDLEAWVSWSQRTPTISARFYINGNPSGSSATTLVAPTTILCQTQLLCADGWLLPVRLICTLWPPCAQWLAGAGITPGTFDVEATSTSRTPSRRSRPPSLGDADHRCAAYCDGRSQR
jgi:hypothetical protein